MVVDVRTAEPPCAGEGAGAVTLVPTGGVAPYGAIWEDFGVGLERDFIFAGEYAGSVYDARGCEIDFAVTLDEPSPLLVRHDMLPPTCYGDRDGVLEVMASGGQTPYVLRVDGGPWAEVLRADTLATGAHSFTLRDDAGCEVTQVVDVRPRSALPTEFEPRIIATREPVMAGDTLQLNVGSLAAGRYTSQWDYSRSAWMACDTCESTDFSPTAPGTVMVSLRDSLGCEARASVALEVPPRVSVPDGFGPGKNDPADRLLRVRGRSGTVIDRFQVFDINGKIVFEDVDFVVGAPRGWDGTHSGAPLPAGDYEYVLEARAPTGEVNRVKGTTTLIR